MSRSTSPSIASAVDGALHRFGVMCPDRGRRTRPIRRPWHRGDGPGCVRGASARWSGTERRALGQRSVGLTAACVGIRALAGISTPRPRRARARSPARAGRHKVAPTSITAWVQSAARSTGTAASASRCISTGLNSPASPATIRPRTRRTFVSTAPTGSPNASAATARAVYGPTPGQRLEVGQIGRHAASELVDDPSRRAPQVERAPVVAEALPRPEDIGRRGGGQRLDRREPVHEPGPRVTRPGGLRLLGHRLGHEDRVRVRAAAERKGSGRATTYQSRIASRSAGGKSGGPLTDLR